MSQGCLLRGQATLPQVLGFPQIPDRAPICEGGVSGDGDVSGLTPSRASHAPTGFGFFHKFRAGHQSVGARLARDCGVSVTGDVSGLTLSQFPKKDLTPTPTSSTGNATSETSGSGVGRRRCGASGFLPGPGG